MSKNVEYILSLKDQFSNVLGKAHEKTEMFNGVLGHTKTLANEMMGALGISFAIFKGFEFVHEGVEAMHALEQAEAQVRAGLESTRGFAGMTFEELETGAKSMARQFKFSRAEIFDMQAQMLTFPSVTKATFEEASQSILDMSTRLHKGLNETAIMVGKALQDPAKGITALRRVGVNFNETQTEIIKRLAATGHAAEAQHKILKELQTEFAGSAKAAADADPLFRFNKIMGSIKMEVGEAAMKLLEELTPALQGVADVIKDVIDVAKDVWHWFGENKRLIKEIGEVLGTTTAAWMIYTAWSERAVIWSAIKTFWFGIETGAIVALGTAVEWVNAMFIASPIGWILLAVAALTTVVIYCYNHFAKFRAVLWGVWETIKEFASTVGNIFMGVGKVIAGVLTLNPSMVSEGFRQTVDAVSNAGSRLGAAFKKGYDDGMKDFAADQANPNDKLAKPGKKKPEIAPTEASTSPGSKVSGQKINTFNITINGGLVHQFTVQTTNITESYAKIRQHVAMALTSSVNDSQIVGDQ